VEPNITDRPALETLLRALIGQASKKRTPAVLVLPDLCARVSILDVEAVPARPSDCDALVRWRLEKESAFPLAGARIVTQPLGPKTLLAVAVQEPILRQYEEVCEAVGLLPMEVDLASLRLWPALKHPAPVAEPAAWLSLLDGGFTFMTFRNGRPAFFRCKIQADDGEAGAFQDLVRSCELAAQVQPGEPPRQLLLVSERPAPDLAQRITEHLRLPVVSVSGRELMPPKADPAGKAMPVAWLPAVAGLRKDPVRLNLSGYAHSAVGSVRAALALVAVLLAGLIVWDTFQARDLDARQADARQAVVRVREQDNRLRLQAQTEGMDLSDDALRKLPREVAFANQVAMKRTFSWTRFLSDLEETVPPRVAINSIRVDSTDTMITLSGSAASLQALTVFIIGLEDHRAFAHAALQQHRVQDNGLVEFSLTVRYHREEKGE
jgi:Tfp pilus assembly protein PilN